MTYHCCCWSSAGIRFQLLQPCTLTENHCQCAHFLYPSSCWWTPRPVLELPYREQCCSERWCAEVSVIWAQHKYEFYCLILFEWGCERPCRGRRLTLMSPSVVLHFIFRDRFPMKLELTNSTCLAGQWAPGLCLCFLPQCQWLAFMWVLGLLMITGQAPYPLSASAAPSLLLFNVRFYGMLKFVLSSLQSSKKALMGILWIVVSFLMQILENCK